jgi:hypothetical protein
MMEDDPRFDPVIRRYERRRGVWGWVAAVSSLLLVGLIILASWNNNIASSDSSQPNTVRRTATPSDHRGLRLVIAEADHPAPSKSGTQ